MTDMLRPLYSTKFWCSTFDPRAEVSGNHVETLFCIATCFEESCCLIPSLAFSQLLVGNPMKYSYMILNETCKDHKTFISSKDFGCVLFSWRCFCFLEGCLIGNTKFEFFKTSPIFLTHTRTNSTLRYWPPSTPCSSHRWWHWLTGEFSWPSAQVG